MITIHWLWLPFVILVILYLLYFIFNGFEWEPRTQIANFLIGPLIFIAFVFNIIIYGVYLFYWLFTHITVTT